MTSVFTCAVGRTCTRARTIVLAVGILLLNSGITTDAVSARQSSSELSLSDRIAYQYAIEQIYWRHRIWPKENGAPKPSLDELMSFAQVQQKVESYLRDSELLANYWQQPITSGQLQAEMERMASHSKQSEVLQELFAALNNDPALIAECLVRPALANRLVRDLYAHDERFHRALKQSAESELHSFSSVNEMKHTSGVYTEITWIRTDTTQRSPTDSSTAIGMNAEEWQKNIEKLARQFGGQNGASEGSKDIAGKEAITQIQSGVLSRLQENESQYYVTAILEKGEDRLKLGTIAWLKEPFESWATTAEREVPRTPTSLTATYNLYTLPDVLPLSTSCVDDTWTATATTSAPELRGGHRTVWTGTEMIVWGGYDSLSVFGINIGARYSPSTDIWVATSTANAPGGRFLHTAVWTGNEMIVWGGDNWTLGEPAATLNTGGKYDPATDNWVPTNTVNAPESRYQHTSVWTGSEMIVWGGALGFGSSGDGRSGGRYNPRTNTWVATNLTSAPERRTGHSAIWTGSEMIIWGGYDFDVLNTGARYRPTTNSWTVTSANAAPTPRYHHRAIWTGSEMIVWGGADESSDLNSGGRYTPGTDTWLATNTTNAPEGRSDPSLVWTGSEMIVWGGVLEDIGLDLNTGGRYNSAADSWLTTTDNNAPSARHYHTAIWTGSEMIVWGGFDTTGGRYCAQPPLPPTPTPTPPTSVSISGHVLYCANPSPNPVAGVTLTLTGSSSASVATDVSGNYTFLTVPYGGNYLLTPSKPPLPPAAEGINTTDAIAANRHFLGIATIPPGCAFTAAGVNWDGRIDTSDVIAIQRFYAGRTSGLANTGTYVFNPSSRSYSGVVSNQTNQDYGAIVVGDVVAPFANRLGAFQVFADGEKSSNDPTAIILAVRLPQIATQGRKDLAAPVTVSVVDEKDNLVGFQGDFTFDERVSFDHKPVRAAGLTSNNWSVIGNTLEGVGPIRTMRISAYSTNFRPLSGSGTLFELRIIRLNNRLGDTQLNWAGDPNDFIFIDTNLRTHRPSFASSGGG